MRKNISSIYLSVLAVVDTTVLYTGLLRHWIRHISDTDIQSISIGGCKFHLFIAYFSLDLSAWILVAVTFERFVAVYIPNKVRIYCTGFTTFLTVCVISLALSFINHHYFWTLEDIKMNELGGLECVYNEEVKDFMMYTWPWIYKCVAFFIPLIIMLTGNVLIIIKILKLSSENESKMTSTTAMLLTVNFGFIICTSPIVLYDNFKTTWYPDDEKSTIAKSDLHYAICSLLMYTNNSINFLLYCLAGPKFRRELRNLFSKRKESQVAPASNIQSLPDVETLPGGLLF
ncbi:unnamed protein product [Owenia fusiformis]|uniref:G-protein coupled receptors family 1 profile domain-containing protein n=2 Tax=Owenia fusiformis TaxID=6347 RepID=A0A8S4NID0_OWEFU|nr:unnamed protein product [Owenia fusiformis]